MTIKVKCGHKIIHSRKINIEKKRKKIYQTVMKNNREGRIKRVINPINKEVKCQ